MDLLAVIQELEETLGEIEDMRVFKPGERITGVGAVVGWPEQYYFDQTCGRGEDSFTLPVTVLVPLGGGISRTIQEKMAAFCNGSGDQSIKQALDTNPDHEYESCDVVHVTGIQFDVTTVTSVEYLAAIFSVDITGSGNEEEE